MRRMQMQKTGEYQGQLDARSYRLGGRESVSSARIESLNMSYLSGFIGLAVFMFSTGVRWK